MTKLKISAKMHIMIIVSAVIIALGIAVGCICHFVADGYFNYGGEYTSYQSVTVSYVVLDEADVSREICDKEFDKAGVKYYNYSYVDSTSAGGELGKIPEWGDKDIAGNLRDQSGFQRSLRCHRAKLQRRLSQRFPSYYHELCGLFFHRSNV